MKSDRIRTATFTEQRGNKSQSRTFTYRQFMLGVFVIVMIGCVIGWVFGFLAGKEWMQ